VPQRVEGPGPNLVGAATLNRLQVDVGCRNRATSSELLSLVGYQLTRFKLIYPEFMVYLLSGPRLNGVDSNSRLKPFFLRKMEENGPSFSGKFQ
jgi:hypothetical protein